MYDALVLAKNEGYDVFNALDIMENEKFLKVSFLIWLGINVLSRWWLIELLSLQLEVRE